MKRIKNKINWYEIEIKYKWNENEMNLNEIKLKWLWNEM